MVVLVLCPDISHELSEPNFFLEAKICPEDHPSKAILRCDGMDGKKEKNHKCFANGHAPPKGTEHLTRFDLEFKLISLHPQGF